MTATILAAASLLIVAAVAVYAVTLLQAVTQRALDHVAREAEASRAERDVLLDRLQSPFAAQQRLAPEGATDLGPDDAQIDREWAEQPESAVTIPEDLMYAFSDETQE